MKKNILLLLSLIFAFATSITLSSCGGDDEEPKRMLSFTDKTLEAKESDGTIEVEVKLDKPATKDLTIQYNLSGTAVEKSTVDPNEKPYDYEDLNEGEIKIKKGESAGVIEFDLYSDPFLDPTETIEIKFASVDDNRIEFSTTEVFEITLAQEDGLLIGLEWGVGIGENYTDVDMDLILWAQDETAKLVLTDLQSAEIGFESPEGFFLPTVFLQDGSYGLSCIYYSGSADPMNFKVTFIEIVNEKYASVTSKLATYTKNNINGTWDKENGAEPLLALTFKKSGGDFHDFSDIIVSTSGSRISPGKIKATREKVGNSSALFQNFLKRLKK